MDRKRSRLETIYTILTLSINGIKKTHIMYRANLSHQQLNKYLKILHDKQLLTKNHDIYMTSEKGRKYIKKFKEIQIIMGELDPINLRF